MSDQKSPKPIQSIQRSFNRNSPLLLVGNSRRVRDLELMLEDQWPELYLVSSAQELNARIDQKTFRFAFFEKNCFGNRDREFIELLLRCNIGVAVLFEDHTDDADDLNFLSAMNAIGALAVKFPRDINQAVGIISKLIETLLSKD